MFNEYYRLAMCQAAYNQDIKSFVGAMYCKKKESDWLCDFAKMYSAGGEI